MWNRDRSQAALALAAAAVVTGAASACSASDRNPPAARTASATPYATPAAGDSAAEAPGASPAASAQLPDCEWCGAREAPAQLGWDIRIAGQDEPGEPLVISGTMYRADAKTPAASVVMYLYHTDARGYYARRGDETGNGQRHGALRGWLRTDARGRYRFATIRPAPYPQGAEPAHVHATVIEPGGPEYWLDEFVFADDPLVTEAYLAGRGDPTGGSGLIELTRSDGVWQGTRDIMLPPAPPATAR